MIIQHERELEELLSTPSKELIEYVKEVKGDLMFLGVAGKMGISLARMAKKAVELAGGTNKIYGVSRFSSPEARAFLDANGILTIKGDLLDPEFLKSLPEAENVIFMAGQKFGTEGNEPMTWAMNAYMPGLVADRFRNSRILVFSTGCVYPLVSVESKGSGEEDPVDPIGEYAQSCLGRERLFEYASKQYGTQGVLIRLFYSVEMRYGVLVDIGTKVQHNIPIDLNMGHANVIWQQDANDMILRSLKYCKQSMEILNIAGPEIFSVREVAMKFGKFLGKPVEFVGKENETALLGNGARAFELLGKPKVKLDQIIQWTASWLEKGGRLLGKPTHFEARDGKY